VSVEDSIGFLFEKLPWKQQAVCRGMDPNFFQMERGESPDEAKAICRQCPVQAPCLAYGLRTGSVGVWGGVLLGSLSSKKVLAAMGLDDARPRKIRKSRPKQGTPVPVPTTRKIAASKQMRG
jgi:WhiB family transcriptional regulator, redox-sensing transcriptional regulator